MLLLIFLIGDVTMGQLSRSQVPQKDQWNVASMYADLSVWQKDYKKWTAQDSWQDFLALKGKLTQSADNLKKGLDAYFMIGRHLEKIYTYAHLRHDEDVAELNTKNAYEEAVNLYQQFKEKSAFLEPELLKMSPGAFEAMMKDSKLKEYKIYLEGLYRMKPHTLSEDKEELLSMASKALGGGQKVFSAFLNADSTFDTIVDSHNKSYELTLGSYNLYLRSQDRVLRKNAFDAMHKHFLKYENTLCEMLTTHIESHIFAARARNFKSALEAALFPYQIGTEVYKNLIQSVKKRSSSLHNYASMRKAQMKLDQLEPYDLYVPMVKDVKMEIRYEEAEKKVLEAAAFLGKTYHQKLSDGLLKQGWVDRYENLRKRSGAYSSGCFDSMPFILMNYQNTLSDAKTLCHEAGHSMHTLLSKENQPYPYSSYSIFVAEVASTFQEEVMFRDLISKTADRKTKAYLLNQMIEDIRATLFRQTMFAEFELKLHEFVEAGTPLSPQLLKQEYKKLYQDYYGSHLHIGDEISIEWARIPHFYYNFYVYQYATGISAAISLVNRCETLGDKAKEDYLMFLKSGSSDYPINLLKKAGVDMTQETAIFDAIDYFDKLMDQFQEAMNSEYEEILN
jgi:oligoendopeptidase F